VEHVDVSPGPMNITIERMVEATLEVRDLIRELNDVLGAAYEEHQRHGLPIEQLFEPNVRFFVARLDGLAVGCGGVAMFDDYAGSSACIPGQRHAVGE
jgi:putative acetyltransferase